MELSVKEYLDSVANPNTRKEYRIGINKFCEWISKSPRELLEMRKDDLTQRPDENIIEYRNRAARFEKEIEKFHSYLLKPGSMTEEQGYKTNTARTLTLGIRQLFRYYQMPVRIRARSKVNKTVKTDKSFPLRIDHVRKMFELADLKAKVILSLATDLGLRISDFIKIKRENLPPLDQEAPIQFNVMTRKEEVVANGFLSDETVKLLNVYTPLLKKDNGYLFPSNGNSHMSDEWINRLLKKLSDKARIDLNGKSLTFHCFRKMFLSAAIDSGIGLTSGKKLCGKAISQSDDTYLTTVKLREKFIQLKRFLTIQKPTKPANDKQLDALEDVVLTLQKQVTQQKLITDTITKENLRMEKELKDLRKELEYFGSQEYADKVVNKIMKIIANYDSYAKRYGRDKPSF